jgi:hypothetical protein
MFCKSIKVRATGFVGFERTGVRPRSSKLAATRPLIFTHRYVRRLTQMRDRSHGRTLQPNVTCHVEGWFGELTDAICAAS